MSNFIYGKAKEAFLNGLIDISNDQVSVVFVKNTYVPSVSSDEFLSDIGASNIASSAVNLVNVTNQLGIIDAQDILLNQHTGEAFKAVVIFINKILAENSRLIAYIDTSNGLPFSGTNQPIDITISWNNDSNKIISI
jgi:hypothetical protein